MQRCSYLWNKPKGYVTASSLSGKAGTLECFGMSRIYMLRNPSQWWDSWNMQRNFDLHNTFKSYITTCITLDQDVSHIERRASWRGDTAGGGCQWGSSLLGSRECHPKVTWAGAEVNITSFSNFINQCHCWLGLWPMTLIITSLAIYTGQ